MTKLTVPDYAPDSRTYEVLRHGRIIDEGETATQMVERVVATLFSVEERFGTSAAAATKAAEELAGLMVDGYVMAGTPILTNAGRSSSALASCAVIPVDLSDLSDATTTLIRSYYAQNMGSGFNLSDCADPVGTLAWLNRLAARETASGAHDRYIGNMAILPVDHPRVAEFVQAKRTTSMPHFNISVGISGAFLATLAAGRPYELRDGRTVDALELLRTAATNALHNGEPGLVFLDRLGQDNPLLGFSDYVATPPCAEMGLSFGETCQFGYLNLARFVRSDDDSEPTLDWNRLWSVTSAVTRALDNAVEYGLSRYPGKITEQVTSLKRRIGIGVCGLAEMLLAFRLPYGAPEARALARDVLSYVTFASKTASHELALHRGSCGAMALEHGNRYLSEPFLEHKYGRSPTTTVTADRWQELGASIRSTRALRNLSTTALPPTGRASLLLGVNSSIEPFLDFAAPRGRFSSPVASLLTDTVGAREAERAMAHARDAGTFGACDQLPTEVRDLLRTAAELDVDAHLRMVADLAGTNGVVDESASKTVNLAADATVDDVIRAFDLSIELGLKSISIYRARSVPVAVRC